MKLTPVARGSMGTGFSQSLTEEFALLRVCLLNHLCRAISAEILLQIHLAGEFLCEEEKEKGGRDEMRAQF